MVMRERSQRGDARRVEPTFDGRSVPRAGRKRKIVRQGPDAREQWNEVRVSIVERPHERRRSRWRIDVQQRWIVVEQRGDERLGVPAPARALDESDLHAEKCRLEDPRLLLEP